MSDEENQDKLEVVELPPDPGRMASALRGFGYAFDAAVCDLIDNSIAAEATAVNLVVTLDANNLAHVKVVDNGYGMNRDELLNAMKLGADDQPDVNRLGKFGFGLKTASTAFTSAFTVVSKKKGRGQTEYSATYDVHKIIETGKWLVSIGQASTSQQQTFEDDLERLNDISGENTKNGTVVYWDRVDRLLQTRGGQNFANAQMGLQTKIKQAKSRIALVFHRFLDADDDRAQNVKIYINEELIEPYDPFFEKHKPAEIAESFQVKDAEENLVGEFGFRGFVLIDYRDLNLKRSDMRWGNNQQGIYCYRNNRLVDGPSFFDTGYTPDTHTNAARLELSFDEELDDVFGLSVTKDRLTFPQDLTDEFARLTAGIVQEANKQARGRNKKKREEENAGGKQSDETIENLTNQGGLTGPTFLKGDDGVTVMENNSDGPVQVTDADGQGVLFVVLPEDTPDNRHISYETALDDGVLWEPALGSGFRRTKVRINGEHPWMVKTFLADEYEPHVREAMEYLIFALAVAEWNNTTGERAEIFEQMRRDVSSNLRVLVEHLPVPDAE